MRAEEIYFSDQEVIDGLLYGKESVIEQITQYLYDTFAPMINAMVFNHSGDISDAKDVFQEAIMALITNIQTGSYRGGATIKTYLYKIALNRWYAELQQRKVKQKIYDRLKTEIRDIGEESSQQLLHEAEHTKKLTQFWDLYDTLDATCKELLEAFYFKEMPYQQIAAVLHFNTPNAAKIQKFRCLHKLIKLIKQDGLSF